MSRRDSSTLDLTFLATGSRQHVFVRTGPEEDSWVYKIPAAYGRVLPYGMYLQRRATSTHTRGQDAVFTRLVILAGWSDGATGPTEASPSGPPGAALKQTHKVYSKIRDSLFGLVFSWKTGRVFRSMVGMMDHISRRGIENVLLPYEVIPQGEARLHVKGRSFSYRGPILLQRRSRFLGLSDFGTFEWSELIAVQHRLWRNGIALVDKERLGPSNWALLDGHVRLGDTSSLTRNFHRAYRALESRALDDRVGVVLERLKGKPHLRPLAEEYYRAVRREINQRKLNELWGVDLGSEGASGS